MGAIAQLSSLRQLGMCDQVSADVAVLSALHAWGYIENPKPTAPLKHEEMIKVAERMFDRLKMLIYKGQMETEGVRPS